MEKEIARWGSWATVKISWQSNIIALEDSRMKTFDIPKSGKLDKWVYYMRRGTQCRRKWVKPRDPRTPGQLGSRSRFGAASKAWSRRLTEEMRGEWRVAGAKVRSRPRLLQSGKLTGQTHFVGRNCAKARIGREMLMRPAGIEEAAESAKQAQAAAPAQKSEIVARPARGLRDRRIIVTQVQQRGAGACPRKATAGRVPSQVLQRQRVARSTWEQYRSLTVVTPYQCRRSKGVTAGRRKARLAGVRRNGRRRELWHGS